MAVGGVLPQPLEYLVNDVARRHGAVRVRASAACCGPTTPPRWPRSWDEGPGPLGLVALAPTVLASALDAAATLAALRAAGFAPAAEDATGAVLIDHPALRRPRRGRVRRVAR